MQGQFYMEDYLCFTQDYKPDLLKSHVIMIHRQRLGQVHILNDYSKLDNSPELLLFCRVRSLLWQSITSAVCGWQATV